MAFSICGAAVARDANNCTKRRTDTPLQGTTVRRSVILLPTTSTLAHNLLGKAALLTEVRRIPEFYALRLQRLTNGTPALTIEPRDIGYAEMAGGEDA
jgi:hypothetical protein